jgi:hypothetical protein
MVASNMLVEKGWTGLSFMAGHITEDPSYELRGRLGADEYNKMRYTDPTVAGVLLALSLPIREAQWQVNPASDQAADREAAEFVESCLHDMSSSLDDVLTEASTMFCFGWSYMEWVLKRRLGRKPGGTKASSAHDDGRIGFRKIALRKQTSLWEWELDDSGGILGMWQERLKEPAVFIPIEKALLFRTTKEGNNPEGLSILRPAYRDWTFKTNIERIEAIGLQRALMGVPVVTLGQGATGDAVDSTGGHEAKAREILASLHKNSSAGVIEDGETLTFRFESPDMTGVTGDSDRVIQRKDEGIARSALASWLLLGTREKGSYALARELGDMFFIAVEGYLQTISQVFTRWAIPTLFTYNAFPGITGYPEITTSINRRVDLEAIAKVVNELVSSQVLTPDLALEQHVREIAGLPRKAIEVDGEGDREPVTPAPKDEGEDVIAGPAVAEKEGAARQEVEKFVALPTLDRYKAGTDQYKAALTGSFETWLDGAADDFAGVIPEDAGAWFDKDWPEAVAALVTTLKTLAWEWIPAGYELGFKSSGIPAEQRREIEYEMSTNDNWMDSSLGTAVQGRVTLADLVEISYMLEAERREAFRGLVIGKRGHVGLYAGAFWRAIWAGAIAYYLLRDEAFKVRWITDVTAKHCPDCLLFGDVTYESFNTLMRHTGGILPGNGTICDGNCRCYLARDDGATLIVV